MTAQSSASVIALLAVMVMPTASLLAAPQPVSSPVSSPVSQPSAFCQTQLQQQAYDQWADLAPWLSADVPPRSPLSDAKLKRIAQLLTVAKDNPKQSQLAIDRLTLAGIGSNNLQYSQPLLTLFDRIPSAQKSQLLPIVNQLVASAQALPPGYNYAQSRALIAASHAYQRLGQQPSGAGSAIALLEKASKIAGGITQPLLRAETQWRLSQAQAAWGQTQAEATSLDQVRASLQVLPRNGSGSVGPVAEKLVARYLQRQQFDKAIAIAQTLNPRDEGAAYHARIAAAYLAAKQPQKAQAYFNQTITQQFQVSRSANDNWDYVATEAIISLAQAGGVTTAAIAAAKIPANVPQYRARAWLAIAAEARQQNRPKEASVAFKQLLAAGEQGRKINFGMGFGDQRDYEWSQPMSALSNAQGYEPEMVQFIEQLKLQSEGAEFLITAAIKAKQFDKAKKLVPIPMYRGIDAGVFEVQNDWLLRVAIAAAQAGQPQQLLDLSQRLQEEFRSGGGGFDAMGIDTTQRLITAIQQQGQGAAIPPLVELLQQQAKIGLAQPDRLQYNIPIVQSMVTSLREQGQTAAADKMQQGLVAKLNETTDLNQRFQLFQSLFQWSSPSRDQLLSLAEAIAVTTHPEFANWIFRQSVAAIDLPAMEQWVVPASQTPILQVDRFSYLGDQWLLRDQPEKAIAWYDRALAALPNVNVAEDDRSLWWQSLINGYLRLGNIAKAKQAAQRLPNRQEREATIQRLACLSN